MREMMVMLRRIEVQLVKAREEVRSATAIAAGGAVMGGAVKGAVKGATKEGNAALAPRVPITAGVREGGGGGRRGRAGRYSRVDRARAAGLVNGRIGKARALAAL